MTAVWNLLFLPTNKEEKREEREKERICSIVCVFFKRI
jgi:hypothetical protein